MLVDRDVVDLSPRRVMELHHRAVSREQLRRFEGYLAEIFAACGLNLNSPATEETPRRFLQALFEATEGYDGEPKLRKVFASVVCANGPVISTSAVTFSKDGDAHINQQVALPAQCVGPIVLIRAALDGEPWIAASGL